jgi:twitching motility protein PilT
MTQAEPNPSDFIDDPSDGTDGPAATPVEKKTPRFEKFCRAMVKMDASDLHLKADCPARLRVAGSIRSVQSDPLSNEKIEKIMFEIMNDTQKERYKEKGSMDFAYQAEDGHRFRINIFRQRGNSSVAARKISTEILDYSQLHLPASLEKIAGLHQGLILVAGITGSGKSTTIAAMIDQINRTRACHIVTLEDPIEFLFQDRKAFVNQREIGLDVADFKDALKYLMREDPDVVLIGEMRDEETFGAAIHAAESGHLVFGTVHASGTAGTISRVLELFPEEARPLIRSSLVYNLQAVVCLKLLPSIHPEVRRIPSCEIMIANPSIRKKIAE